MTTAYKQIQLTNNNIASVEADAFIPLGKVTRRINAPYNCCNTFILTSSTDDTLVLNDTGFYKVTYSLTATAAAAGTITVALITDGTSIHTVSQSIVDETSPVNLTLVYTIRVCPNCASAPDNVPVSLQIQNTGVALTGQSANLIVEKI